MAGTEAKDFNLSEIENTELSRQIGIYGILERFLKRLEFAFQLIIHKSYEHKLIDFQTKLKFNKIISVKNISALNKAIIAYNEQMPKKMNYFDIDTFENGNQDFVTIDAHPGIFNVTQLKTDVAKDLSVIGILKEQIALLIEKDDKIQVLRNI